MHGKKESNIKLSSSNSASSQNRTSSKYSQSRPRSSIVSGVRKQPKLGTDLFNATAPIKFFNNLEDLTTLRDSFNAVCPAGAIPEKQSFLAASMRLGSTQVKAEQAEPAQPQNPAKPKSAERGGAQAAASHSYQEVNLNSTTKKKRIRQKIMNSSYISGNLASSSVTSESRPKFKKGLKDQPATAPTAAAAAAQEKRANPQNPSQRNSYTYLATNSKKSVASRIANAPQKSSSSLSYDKLRTEASYIKTQPRPQSETHEQPPSTDTKKTSLRNMLVTQRAIKCISTLLVETGSYSNPRREAAKVPTQVRKSAAGPSAPSTQHGAAAKTQSKSSTSLKLSQKADGSSRHTLEMLQKNSHQQQQASQASQAKQQTLALPTFARVDLEKVNKKIKVKSGRNSS